MYCHSFAYLMVFVYILFFETTMIDREIIDFIHINTNILTGSNIGSSTKTAAARIVSLILLNDIARNISIWAKSSSGCGLFEYRLYLRAEQISVILTLYRPFTFAYRILIAWDMTIWSYWPTNSRLATGSSFLWFVAKAMAEIDRTETIYSHTLSWKYCANTNLHFFHHLLWTRREQNWIFRLKCIYGKSIRK